LSFKESLLFSNVELQPLQALSTTAANNLKYHFNQYLQSSGFPEAFAKKNTIYRRLLNQYFEDILYKDIVVRHGANYQKLKDIALYLLTNHANLFSLRSVRGWVEMGINTISEYVGYLEDAWLIFQSAKYDVSLKKQLVNPKKVYAIDLGLRNAVSFRFSEDLGRNLENLVAIELKRRGREFYYWKNSRGMETDFLIRERSKIEMALQVTAKLDDPKIKQREINSLLAAMDEFDVTEGLILTLDESGSEKIGDKRIRWQPIWQWLLE
jgi:predicted AAA+ superfamily ATPase